MLKKNNNDNSMIPMLNRKLKYKIARLKKRKDNREERILENRKMRKGRRNDSWMTAWRQRISPM
jgi:hypothetical protein